MRMRLQRAAVWVVVCLVLPVFSAAGESAPGAGDLVARMNESFKNSLFARERFLLEWEAHGVSSGDLYQYDKQGNLIPDANRLESHVSVQLGRDGARAGIRVNTGNDSDKAFHECAVAEGGTLIRARGYGQEFPQVERSKHSDAVKAMLEGRSDLGACEGRFLFEQLSLMEVFEAATTITAQPGSELVDGVETCVVEGVTPYGKYKLWLDPASGCLPRRVEITKEGTDLYEGKPLNRPVPPLPEGKKWSVPWEPLKRIYVLADSITIVKAGDTFCVTGWSKYHSDTEYESGKKVSWSHEAIKNTLDLDPDPALLAGVFKLDIPDGSFVIDKDLRGANLRWQDGQVVPAADRGLRNLVEEKEPAAQPNPAPAEVQPAAQEKPPTRPRPRLWFAVVPVMCIGVAAVGIFIRRKL